MNTSSERLATERADEQEITPGVQSNNMLRSEGVFDQTRAWTELHLADGRVLRLDTQSLLPDSSASQSDVLEPPTHAASEVNLDDSVTIPLIEEHVVLEKRIVETGKVRLHKTVQQFDQQLDEPLAVNTFDIERVILNQPIAAAPEIRQEGDTTVYPLVEEQLVLTRQLILKEEVRVTRRITESRDTRVVTLRRDHLSVERESSMKLDEEPGHTGQDEHPAG